MSSPPVSPLLKQFLGEARDLLECSGAKLLQLEDSPDDPQVMNELFRCVHTLKGNSGLFSFPEMTRVLHAAEDLLEMVRSGEQAYSRELADCLLEAMDFVATLCSDIEATQDIHPSRAAASQHMTEVLRQRMPSLPTAPGPAGIAVAAAGLRGADGAVPTAADEEDSPSDPDSLRSRLSGISESIRRSVHEQCRPGDPLHWIAYRPQRECFFHGDDPLNTARQTPGLLWGRIFAPESMPALSNLDTYNCMLSIDLLTNAPREELDQYYRYLPDQVEITALPLPWLLNRREGRGAPIEEASAASPGRSFSETDWIAWQKILTAQRQILLLEDRPAWHAGRLKAVAAVLANLNTGAEDASLPEDIQAALADALSSGHNTLLLAWLDAHSSTRSQTLLANLPESCNASRDVPPEGGEAPGLEDDSRKPLGKNAIKFGRRAEDAQGIPKSLKVDQAKIDRLMNLIGELIVSKNALPYLAERAEAQFGVRELSREIKGQYSIINRIADEMQDAVMQVRMMAVSFVFQRFPRLVRDLSRKLGKEVQLLLEGEQTEADKNIIESLADPLIHIVRNSLDHGLETPQARLAMGKPATGKLVIRATQQADRVEIEICDDGKGIDPAVIKQKAYEKGIIDEAMLERISDAEAVNLIFAAGLSTANVVSDLSGRGVGMDVVRSAVEKMNGTVAVQSEVGKGTTIRISLPLSMAVTQVMVVESDQQLFGVPMDHVIETVRVPRSAIRTFKQSQTAVLRGRVVPLKSLNALLNISAIPRANSDDEIAVLLVQAGGVELGLIIDGFRETIDVIQKPLVGFLSGLAAFSGLALLGNGSVLMILNIREIV